MTVTVVELAEQVVIAVNAARAAKSDENIVVELEEVLKELRASESKLASLAALIPELPDTATPVTQLESCGRLLARVEEACRTDAVGAARSDEGRALVREIRALVTELTQSATVAWNDFRQQLRAEVRTDFLRKLNDLPGFDVARRLLADNYAVQEVVVSSRLPDVEKVRRAKEARKGIDEGLRELQALLPPEIQRPLDDCFRNRLRLIDVKPEFVDWIRRHGLEDEFTVSAS